MHKEWEITVEGMSKMRRPQIFNGRLAARTAGKMSEMPERLEVFARNGGAGKIGRYLVAIQASFRPNPDLLPTPLLNHY